MPSDLSEELKGALGPVVPALGWGVGNGLLGVCIGGGVGILRSAHPGIAAAYTGAQFFVLASTASLTRDVFVASRRHDPTRPEELAAATLAGLVSGAAAGRFWGRFWVVPGGAVFAAAGYLSQRSAHRSKDAGPRPRDSRSLMQRFADSNWSPVKSLSNDEYETILSEKLVRVESEIATVNQKLETLPVAKYFRAARRSRGFSERQSNSS